MTPLKTQKEPTQKEIDNFNRIDPVKDSILFQLETKSYYIKVYKDRREVFYQDDTPFLTLQPDTLIWELVDAFISTIDEYLLK